MRSPSLPKFVSLQQVLPKNAGLSLAEKRQLLCQARVLLEHTYVHLHLKQALYGIDPIQRISTLQYRLEDPQDIMVNSELAFHRELLGVFKDMRDLHTHYILPRPYRHLTAFLPFLLEQYYDAEQQAHYIVSKIANGYQHTHFTVGVEIELWNGVPIADAIRHNGERAAGSNEAARFAVGLGSLTIRPLATDLPPDEKHIRLTYVDQHGEQRTIELEWQAMTHQIDALDYVSDPLLANQQRTNLYQLSLMGNHLQTGQVNYCRKLLYAPDAWRAEQLQNNLDLFHLEENHLRTRYPALLRAKAVQTTHGTFGYLRLFSFIAPQEELFISEIMRLLHELPQDGLILDVRGNSGGYISMTERLLQLFTPQTIQPEQAQFRATAFTRELCRHNAPSPAVQDIDLSAWIPSLEQAHASGSLYSTAHSLTDPIQANNLGQAYAAPVVLITDAQCYSATDMFAAGFQDHGIGKVLGVDDNTGAGGSNVWPHHLLRTLAEVGDIAVNAGTTKLEPLPRQAEFRVSIRRMLRTAANAGMPLEDFGVRPDARHYMTRRDLLAGNCDLIEHAASILAAQPRYLLDVALQLEQTPYKLRIHSQNIDRLDWYLNERPAGSKDIKSGKLTLRLPKSALGKIARLEGFLDGNRVVSRVVKLYGLP